MYEVVTVAVAVEQFATSVSVSINVTSISRSTICFFGIVIRGVINEPSDDELIPIFTSTDAEVDVFTIWNFVSLYLWPSATVNNVVSPDAAAVGPFRSATSALTDSPDT